jgi:hypothetical protein
MAKGYWIGRLDVTDPEKFKAYAVAVCERSHPSNSGRCECGPMNDSTALAWAGAGIKMLWRVKLAQVSSWPIAIFFCNARFGRYRGTADIDQAALIQRRFYKHAPLSEGPNPCWEPER